MKYIFLFFFIIILFIKGNSQTFVGNSGSILDFQSIDIPLTVSGLSQNSIDTSNFGIEQICFDITHTYDADISMAIVAPDGTTVLLFSNVGGGGHDFQNTCFDNESSLKLTDQIAPFTGTFKPTGQFGLVNNLQDPNGIWYLRVFDGYAGDEGTLNSWSITFSNNPASYFSLQESNLPIVVINTNGQTISDEPKITANMGIIDNGYGNRNHIEDDYNDYNGKIGIELRGHYSASLPQKPYNFELQDNNGNKIDSSILGMPKEHDWLLIPNYNDKSFSRNIIPYEFFEEMGHYAVRHRFVDVVINDVYQGIYILCEKIKRDGDRVNISKLQPNETTGRDVTGGYILKIDYWDNSNSWLLNYSPVGNPGLDIHMVYEYPKPLDIVPEQKTYIQGFMNDLESSLYGTDFKDSILGYRKYMDIYSFIDYFLINELTRNVDGFKKSRYFYKDKDAIDGTISKLYAGPVWDFDWSQKDMGNSEMDGSGFNYLNVAQDVNAPGYYIRLLEDSNFVNQVRCRYESLRNSIFSQSYINYKIDSVANYINESKDWHFETWGNLGQATGTWEVQPPSQTYGEEIQRLKDWYTRRLTWMDQNLPGNPINCEWLNIAQNLQEDELKIFPVPFQSKLFIEIPNNWKEEITILITNQIGEIVYTQKTNAENRLITLNNMDKLAKGLYTILLISEDQKISKKISN